MVQGPSDHSSIERIMQLVVIHVILSPLSGQDGFEGLIEVYQSPFDELIFVGHIKPLLVSFF